MWRALRNRLTIVLLVATAGACAPAEPTPMPPAPPDAVRIGDWSEFDQERADQLRLGLAEVASRFPHGEPLDLQLWRLPPTTMWEQVRSHYAQQPSWRPDDAMRTMEGPVTPDAQVFLDAKHVTRLDVALFRARSGAAADTAVLVVQRSRM